MGVMGWQWGQGPWKRFPYIQVSDVLCYKPIPIIYRTLLLQNSLNSYYHRSVWTREAYWTNQIKPGIVMTEKAFSRKIFWQASSTLNTELRDQETNKIGV